MTDAIALLRAWRWLPPLPGGRWLFARLACRQSRYFARLHPRFADVRSGRVELLLRTRRALEDRDGSLHLLALSDGGALAAMIVTAVTAPSTHDASIKGLEAELLKKVRGDARIVADLELLPALGEAANVPVGVLAFDAGGEVVLRLTVQMRFTRRGNAAR